MYRHRRIAAVLAAAGALAGATVAWGAAKPIPSGHYIDKKHFVKLEVNKKGTRLSAELCNVVTTAQVKIGKDGSFHYAAKKLSSGIGPVDVNLNGKFVTSKKATGAESVKGALASSCKNGKFTAVYAKNG